MNTRESSFSHETNRTHTRVRRVFSLLNRGVWMCVPLLTVGAAFAQDAVSPAPDAAAAEAGAAASKTIFDHIESGGSIGYLIIILSFIAMALAIAHVITVRESRLAPAEQIEDLDKLLRAGDVSGAIRYCQSEEHDSFLTRVLGSALARCAKSPFGFLELKAAVEEAGQIQIDRLHRSTDGIGLISSIAPMLGLLGTVVGMVGAFETIGAVSGPVKPSQLAGYIAVALITTVLGLIVAIPCTAAYSFFRNRIDRLAEEIGEVIEELALHLEQSGKPRHPANPLQRAMAANAAGSPRPMPMPVPRPAPVTPTAPSAPAPTEGSV